MGDTQKNVCMACWQTTDKIIECMCNWKCCEECNQKYISLHYTDPHCMNLKCKAKWTERFMAMNFSKKWYNGNKKGQYRYLTKLKLLEQEKAQIPVTLSLLNEIGINFTDNDLFWSEIRYIIGINKPKSNYQYVCPCTAECNGLIDLNYECLVCKNEVCKKCREIVIDKEIHQCDKNTVKTIKELKKKSTKPCPKCAVAIFKIDGCDQRQSL